MNLRYAVALIVLLVAGLMLSGCAGGPRFSQIEPQANEAIFYFYRNYDLRIMDEWTSVHLNGKVLAQLPEDAYSFARLAPGTHNIKLYKYGVTTGRNSRPYYNISFRVEAGEKIYLRWSTLVGNTDNMLPSGYISRVIATNSEQHGFMSQEQGRLEIAKTKLAAPQMQGIMPAMY